MPDERVFQWGDRECVVVSALNCLEIMEQKEVLSDPRLLYQEVQNAGFTQPWITGIPIDQIIGVMNWLGGRGVDAEGGTIHGLGAYPISIQGMIDGLLAGQRPFLFVYSYDYLGSKFSHAVCVKRFEPEVNLYGWVTPALVIGEQRDETVTENYIPLIAAYLQGVLAFAYNSHTFVPYAV